MIGPESAIPESVVRYEKAITRPFPLKQHAKDGAEYLIRGVVRQSAARVLRVVCGHLLEACALWTNDPFFLAHP